MLRVLCLSNLIPLLIIVLFCYGSWYYDAFDELRVNVNSFLRQTDNSVDHLLTQAEDVALGIVVNTNMRRAVSDGNLSTDATLREEVYKGISDILLTNFRLINAIYIETPETIIFSRLSSSDTRSVYKLGLYDTPYEQTVMDLHASCYWLDGADVDSAEAHPQQGGVLSIRCAAALPSIDRRVFCGMVSIMIRTSMLREVIQNMYDGLDGAYVALIDRNGQEIISSGAIRAELFEKMASLALRNENVGTITLDGERMEAFGIRNEKTGWHLICALPTAAMTGSIFGNMGISLIGCAVIALLCIYLSLYIMRVLSRTIQPLADTMRKIEQGNLSARVPEMSTVEMATVGRVFNHMMDCYDEQMQKNARQQSALLASQLNALQGQLSSHFLYNTLDAINWSLVERREYDISASVAKLGNLLRYCLGSGTDMLPLAQELEAVTSYLEICKLRFEDRLKYLIDIDARFISRSVPRFILQPIVENGIVYGCESSSETVELTIRGFLDGSFFAIEVFNSGSQFPEEEMRRINREQKLPVQQRQHIGLSNIADRMQLIYGEDYALEIHNLPERGVVVRLNLPSDGTEGAKECLHRR